jgi:hypothetical protein
MSNWQALMGDASFEVVVETLHGSSVKNVGG